VIYVNTYKMIKHVNKQLPVSSERKFPATPFPRKYLHCVMNDPESAVGAVYALRTAAYDAGDIHVMASWDYVEAVERRERRRNRLSKILTRFYNFLDEGLDDIYLTEARQGGHMLLVHLTDKEQIEQACALLKLHEARLIKYVDAWTVADLSPIPERPVGQDGLYEPDAASYWGLREIRR
jgi:hypothetical protein